MPSSRLLPKIAAVSSFVLLVAALVAYQSGAFNSIPADGNTSVLAANVAPADSTKKNDSSDTASQPGGSGTTGADTSDTTAKVLNDQEFQRMWTSKSMAPIELKVSDSVLQWIKSPKSKTSKKKMSEKAVKQTGADSIHSPSKKKK